MGANINYLGPADKDQHGKMANQITITGSLAGICEAFNYTEQEGLDLNTLLKAVEQVQPAASSWTSAAKRLSMKITSRAFS